MANEITGVKISKDKNSIKKYPEVSILAISVLLRTHRLNWMIHWKISENGIL